MTSEISDPADFGWSSFFASQVDSNEQALVPVRAMAIHRDRIHVMAPGIDMLVLPVAAEDEESAATVGDWLLLDPETQRVRRVLDRRSLFKRRAAGSARRIQLIAANVDTLFIVSSCNQDFSPARLERYLALANETDVMPVVVLTKADLVDDTQGFVREASRLMPNLLVEVLDGRDPESVARLAPWCGKGQTVALVGSSGVGKSTLVNTLIGADAAATQAIRAHDDTGQHTTTGRAMHRLPAGGWLVDTPGMRELQLADVSAGIEGVFADVVELASGCRFGDCRHDTEPGCAVRAAIEEGTLEEARYRRWRKLAAEETRNSESLHERHARSRAFGKMAKRIMQAKRTRQGS